MSDTEATVAIVAILVAPLVMLFAHWIERNRTRRELGRAESASVQAMAAIAERMERRIESLEMLLDNELPGWRSRSTIP